MVRSALFLFLALAGSATAQEQPARDQAVQDNAAALAALRQTADKAAAAWETLAKGLESKIANLLPCDPKSRAAVEEVSHASDARLAALSAYLKAAAQKARQDTDAAKQVLAAQAALAGGWNTERAEADQEHTAVEARVAELKESMRKRGSLNGAEQVLIEIANMAKERVAKSAEQAGRGEAIDALLGDLVVAYQDRRTALENESALLDAETAKWTSYYTARISRAITECAIINPGAAQRKKQP
jgi:hypothetical protein